MTRVHFRAGLVLFAFRALAGLVVSYPLARSIGALLATSMPDGDLSLFAPGGFPLLETLRVGSRAIPAAVEGAALQTFALSALGLPPLVAALVLLDDRSVPVARAAARSVETFGAMLVVSGMTLLAQALVLVLSSFLVSGATTLSAVATNEMAADSFPLAAILLGVIGIELLSMLRDVARAVIVVRDEQGLSAIRTALSVFPGGFRTLAGTSVTNVAMSAIVVYAAASLTTKLDVSRPGALRVASVFLVHQCVLAALVWLRLRFLGKALDVAPR